MTLSSVVRMVRLRWRTFVIVVFACAVVGLVVALTVPNRYVSSVQLLVTAKGSSTAQSYQNMEIENARATSYLALLRSQVVNQRVVDDVHLPYSAQTLSDRINAALVPKTTIIDVQVAGDTADQARAAADSLAKQFVAYTNAIEKPTGSDDQRVQTTIVSTATEPVRERPGAWVFGLLGALIGVVLGIAAVWIRSRTDLIIRDAEDAASATPGLPVLGHLSDESDSARLTECRRALRAKLDAFESASRVWHVVVVADDTNETAQAVSFARSATAPGDRAIVIAESNSSSSGSDLRQLLRGDASIDEVIRNTNNPATDIILARVGPADPLDPALEKAMRRILDDLRERYGVIIIGSRSGHPTPALASASECADATVLLAVAGSTRRRALTAVEFALRASGTAIAGVILADGKEAGAATDCRTTAVPDDADPVGSSTT